MIRILWKSLIRSNLNSILKNPAKWKKNWIKWIAQRIRFLKCPNFLKAKLERNRIINRFSACLNLIQNHLIISKKSLLQLYLMATLWLAQTPLMKLINYNSEKFRKKLKKNPIKYPTLTSLHPSTSKNCLRLIIEFLRIILIII